MLSELSYDGDPRGTFHHRHISGITPYRNTAKELLKKSGTVFLITGFWIHRYQQIETDGLTGTRVLIDVLKQLGYTVILPVDQATESAFEILFPDVCKVLYPAGSDKSEARQLIAKCNPDAIIAIERPGPDAKLRFRNFNGDDISAMTAPMQNFFCDTILTIAIGDGGNELGMGKLAARLGLDDYKFKDKNSRADFTLVGATSDWSAFSLASALCFLSQRGSLPAPDLVSAFSDRLKSLNIIDGMTGSNEGSVDGYPFQSQLARYSLIYETTERLKESYEILSDWKCRLTEQYGVGVQDVTLQWNPRESKLCINGVVLNKNQLEILIKQFTTHGIQTTDETCVLSDPSVETPQSVWFGVTHTVDLLNRPEGELTTQAIAEDNMVRSLWRSHNWQLIQTPDLALGWTKQTDFLERIDSNVNSAWTHFVRPVQNKLLEQVIDWRELFHNAELYLGSPYLWGGRTLGGIDCSGMVQRIFMHHGILLPRNSRDQRKCGIRIRPTEAIKGDLIFAVGRKKQVHHVALHLGDSIQHACLNDGLVIREQIDCFKLKYRVIAARRITSVK